MTEETSGIERSRLLHALSFSFRFSRFEDDPVHARSVEADALVDYGNALASPDRTLDTTPVTRYTTIRRPGR